MTRTLAPLLAALLLATAPMVHAHKVAGAKPAVEAPVVEKVVYHVNDASLDRVAMRNIQNPITASPDARIVMVTHGKGSIFC